MANSRRIIFYIDGGNLYNRLKEKNRQPYPLARQLFQFAKELCTTTPDDSGVPLNGVLGAILYCNAPISVPKGQSNHLQIFMNRLEAMKPPFRLHKGTRKSTPHTCYKCQQEITVCPNCGVALHRRCVEKGVDLQIAAECVADAADDLFDMAVLFTHDADYSQLVRVIKERFKKETKIAYLATPRVLRPHDLIGNTCSKKGIAIDKVSCFEATFPKALRS